VKNYKEEIEKDIRAKFTIYMDSYGYRAAKEFAADLAYQAEVHKRYLKHELYLKSKIQEVK